MTEFTIPTNNFFISKYQRDLHSLCGYSLEVCNDPLNILDNYPIEELSTPPITPRPTDYEIQDIENEEEVIEPTRPQEPQYLPTDIMSNIISYLPRPPLKPQKFGILTNDKDDGFFGIITKITDKCIYYSKYRINGYGFYCIKQDCRKKLFKDQENRCYYVKDNTTDKFIVSNKLPSRNQNKLTEEKLKELYKNVSQFASWFQRDLPIVIVE